MELFNFDKIQCYFKIHRASIQCCFILVVNISLLLCSYFSIVLPLCINISLFLVKYKDVKYKDVNISLSSSKQGLVTMKWVKYSNSLVFRIIYEIHKKNRSIFHMKFNFFKFNNNNFTIKAFGNNLYSIQHNLPLHLNQHNPKHKLLRLDPYSFRRQFSNIKMELSIQIIIICITS
jgi:hypothetical protein